MVAPLIFPHRQPIPGGHMLSFHRQRGWLGLIGLLLALVIVAILAQKVLKTYGLLSGAEPETKTAGPRGPGGASPAPMDATDVTPTPRAAIERARGLESAVQQQANDINKRMDETAK
jgi:hypothetical protein